MKRIALYFAAWSLFAAWSVGAALGNEFTDALNAQRQARGLGPVAFDQVLIPTSANNNAWQRLKGLGHWDTGGFAQVSAIGTGDISGTLAAWSWSAAHAALLYSPNLASVGYANDGYCATATLVMGQHRVVTSTPQAPTKATPQSTHPAAPSKGQPSAEYHGCTQTAAGCGASTGACLGPGGSGARAPARYRQCGFHPFRRLFGH
jgi:hypothetical protein